jgi:hypothetical protein
MICRSRIDPAFPFSAVWRQAALSIKLPRMKVILRIVAFGLLVATDVSVLAASPSDLRCFKMHGRVAPEAGHPTYRMTPETRTGLIVLNERDRRGRLIDPLLPIVRRLFPTNDRAVETGVTGDFTLCPLEPPRPGRLRLARMVKAQNLSVKTDDWMETNRWPPWHRTP